MSARFSSDELRQMSLNYRKDLHGAIPETNTRPNDTYEVTKIYLQRPARLADLRLSQWFCLAHGLKDWELQNAASLGDCKQQLIDKGYVYLPLEKLTEFNKLAKKIGG